MWNPIQGIQDDWSATSGLAGKLAVFLFYLVGWAMLFVNLYQATIDPSSFGQECVFGTTNPKDTGALAWLVLLTRLWAYGMALVFVYVVYIGAKVGNIAFLTFVVWLGTGAIFMFATESVKEASQADADCLKSMKVFGYSAQGILFVILALALVDAKNRRASSGEYQAIS